MTTVGTVRELWCYPVKSMQGGQVDALDVTPTGVVGDRRWALVDDRGHLLSAKRRKELLLAAAVDGGDAVALPDGAVVALADADASDRLSAWLGQAVEVRALADAGSLTFEMTFDPPDDDAEYYEIPAPPGSFLDLAAVHLVHGATLAACADARPDLDWSVRRFRPNVVLDGELDRPFGEQAWVGSHLSFSSGLRLSVQMATVRCAMPLRAQPGGIEREPEIFRALSELNTEIPNHLGLYLQVAEPGAVQVGDTVDLIPA